MALSAIERSTLCLLRRRSDIARFVRVSTAPSRENHFVTNYHSEFPSVSSGGESLPRSEFEETVCRFNKNHIHSQRDTFYIESTLSRFHFCVEAMTFVDDRSVTSDEVRDKLLTTYARRYQLKFILREQQPKIIEQRSVPESSSKSPNDFEKEGNDSPNQKHKQQR